MTNMKYKVTDNYSLANGTSLKGYVATTYDTLVRLLGEPPSDGCDKTTAEWILLFDDGTIATIYDYKMDSTPYGLYDWHVGGHSHKAHEYVEKLLAKAAKD